MKVRFSTLDVAAAVHDVKQLEGYRVVNVYDINSKTYIIKFSRGAEKGSIIFESGIRIHRTFRDWEKAQFPSTFSLKLRKHLNQNRLIKVEQLSFDRVVDMEIGEGVRCMHLIVELYDRGNIMLTDATYTIVNILRPRTDKDTDVRYSVNQKYPVSPEPNLPKPPNAEEISKMLESCDQKLTLKRLLASTVPGILGGALIDHVLLLHKLDPSLQVSDITQKDQCASQVAEAMCVAARVARKICRGRSSGYVSYTVEQLADQREVEILQEFHPYLFHQHQHGRYRTYQSFCEAVDTFYATISAQKQQQSALKIEKEAIKRLENVKKDQTRRIEELKLTQDEKKVMAKLVIHNKELVDNAIQTICIALAQKFGWEDLEQMLNTARADGDPTAANIAKLDLENNRIILRLSCPEEDISLMEVPVKIDMNAHQNACSLYQGVKTAAEKAARTEVAAQKAIRNAEEKTHNIIKKINTNVSSGKRKEMWFQKFYWFVSSEGYIVLGGRDATQNELLVKRYLRPVDLYVHADVHGAASVIIRNKMGGGPIPPKTLTEAGQMAACYTKGWSSQISPSTWWVYANQVSKVAPSGEYLSKGSFIIRGKKNFLSSPSLTLGFGILFRVDEVTAEKYVKRLKEQMKSVSAVEVKDEQCENVPQDECPALASDDEYPDISLSVPIARLQIGNNDDISVVEMVTKKRKTAKLPTKEQQTREYLEKKAEEERKVATVKKMGKRQKHKLEKIRKKYADQDEEEREIRMSILGSRGKKSNADTEKKQGHSLQKTQSSHSRSEEDSLHTAKSVKQDTPQAYMEFEVVETKEDSRGIEAPLDSYHGDNLICGQGSQVDESKSNAEEAGEPFMSENTQSSNVEMESFSADETQPITVEGVETDLMLTQKSDTEKTDVFSAAATQDTMEDITSSTQCASLDSENVVTVFRDAEIDGKTIKTTSTQDFSAESQDATQLTAYDCKDHEATENPDELWSASTQSVDFDPKEADANLKDCATEDVVDNKPIVGKKEVGEELQHLEEDDTDDELVELTATEGTENLIAQLVPFPDPEDVLLYAVPMVGPYQALQNFKYKVKITPGTTRKGKAGKTALELFLRDKKIPPMEKDLIRVLVSDDKTTMNLPSGCRVSAPQLHAKK